MDIVLLWKIRRHLIKQDHLSSEDTVKQLCFVLMRQLVNNGVPPTERPTISQMIDQNQLHTLKLLYKIVNLMERCKTHSWTVLNQVDSKITPNFLMKLHGSQKWTLIPIKLELNTEIDSTNLSHSINQLWLMIMEDSTELMEEVISLFMILLMVPIHLDNGMAKTKISLETHLKRPTWNLTTGEVKLY